MSLKKQAISGLFWTFTQQFSVQIINVLISIVLARILLPAEFGLIGMLTIFIAIGNSLMDSGMTSSLIRKKDADQVDYSTVFFVNLIFSVVIYCSLFFFAPLIALFFKQPTLDAIVKVYTLSFIIKAFVGVQTTKLTKELKFKVQMMMQIPSVIAGGIVGIVLAYNGYGVWSLVWMNLSQSFLFTLQHWIFAGWTPNLVIDRSRLRYHLHFGYKLTVSGLLDTIYSNVYNIVIGKFFSPSELGYFTRAQTLQMLPVNNITAALEKVTYPLFSSIKDENEKLKSAYKKLMQQVVFGIAPLMIYLMIVAKPLFIFLLTSKWLPAVPYFQILCITGILYPFHSYNLNILKVKGRSDLFLKLEIYKKIFITVGIAIAIFWGIYGLLIFQVISSVFAFWINTFYSGKFINYPGLEQIKDVSPSIIISVVVGVSIYALFTFFNFHYALPNLVILLITAVIFASLYLLLCHFFEVLALKEFRLLILKK